MISSLRFFARAREEEIFDDYAWNPCLTTDAYQDAKLFIPLRLVTIFATL